MIRENHQCRTSVRALNGSSHAWISPSEALSSSSPSSSSSSISSSSSLKRGRAAVCLRGQLRGLPVSYASWRETLLPYVTDFGSLDLDFFAVTPASPSYVLWKGFLDSLQPVDTFVIESVHYVKDDHGEWQYKDDSPGTLNRHHHQVHLNLNAFPFVGNEPNFLPPAPSKTKVFYIQYYEGLKCSQLIAKHESKRGFRYQVVASLRPDTWIRWSPLPWSLPKEGDGEPQPAEGKLGDGQGQLHNQLGHLHNLSDADRSSFIDVGEDQGKDKTLKERMETLRTVDTEECASLVRTHIRHSDEWFLNLGGDFAHIGSRDTMMRSLRTLVRLRGTKWMFHVDMMLGWVQKPQVSCNFEADLIRFNTSSSSMPSSSSSSSPSSSSPSSPSSSNTLAFNSDHLELAGGDLLTVAMREALASWYFPQIADISTCLGLTYNPLLQHPRYGDHGGRGSWEEETVMQRLTSDGFEDYLEAC